LKEPGVTDAPVLARYFDTRFQLEAVKILPGQCYAAQRDVMIVTVLGSCVSACLWDAAGCIGGMNHFMLPGTTRNPGDVASVSARLGVYAMELLINQVVKLGAVRGKLVAKVFGGGKVLEGLDTLNVGDQNGEFVLDFLREEGIPVVAKDLYDVWPRKVYFFPKTGKVLVKKLRSLSNDTVGKREHDYYERINQVAAGGDFELFSKGRK
jgi:chemotaxis protein CheD